ncbi:FKBP12-associated protein [Scheffersomyces spartinae]|uniref:FKBP12-associated protein n=1 Tax=Scheffersomyces spartinae TaxID=45513 RepID=A0A9P8AH23_9ASCO|nr:FKBP12-associated protein [Scheffersomyces spartinae]KAG7192253.1 FKBP12-associated protein [Scheffersomyces spartinae]
MDNDNTSEDDDIGDINRPDLSADTSECALQLETDSVTDVDSEAYSDSESESEPDSNLDQDLATTIINEIRQGDYVCLVCTGEIDANAKVWSCGNCYRVYDLDCIRDWAQRGSSTNRENKTWRCPACSKETKRIPSRFACWCGKVTNPKPNPENPFSCMSICDQKFTNCIHSCTSVCHPAKHPLCGALGPVMKCQCGKHEQQLPCLVTPYDQGWRCDTSCDVELCEFGHRCGKGCHKGFCGPCQELITMSCYCGKEDLTIKCLDKILKRGELWIGVGKCSHLNEQYYDCGSHFETVGCQPFTTPPKCIYSPELVTTCYCGKTNVGVLNRSKCTDPIPECDNVCGKLLPCGCTCRFKCHEGPCECFNILSSPCSCGNGSYLVPCKFLQAGLLPKCTHKCTVLLNCRKHYHREECCEYEQIGLKRLRERKKALRNNTRTNSDDDIMTIEPVHICTRPCNKLKQCGTHYCAALCHLGSCEVCLESTNDDLVCHCGKTVLQAPVRCGTKLVCHEQCVRDKPCGHPQEPHECHDETIECPKCTTTVTKECNCGAKKDMKGVLCSQNSVLCGTVCTKSKLCGHPCMNVCSPNCTKHDIHSSSSVCQSMCKKIRSLCPHYCKLKCHANKLGKSPKCDATVCSHMVEVSCACGSLKMKTPCGSSLTTESNIGKVLECDDLCFRHQRDLELKKAFFGNGNGNSASSATAQVEEQFPYTKSIVDTYTKQTTWCSRMESFMREFVENPDKRFYYFPIMIAPQQQFICELADLYKLYHEILGDESSNEQQVLIVLVEQTELPSLTIEAAIYEREKSLESIRIRQEKIDLLFMNAIIIKDVFFGVTKERLEREFLENPLSQNGCIVKLRDYVYYNTETYLNSTSDSEAELYALMRSIKNSLRTKSLAFECKLGLIDEEVLTILKETIKVASTPTNNTTPANDDTSDGITLTADNKVVSTDDIIEGIERTKIDEIEHESKEFESTEFESTVPKSLNVYDILLT